MTASPYAIPVMGTVVSIDVRTPGSASERTDAIDRVTRWLQWVDATFSTYKPDSEISRLDRQEMTMAECEPMVGEILTWCDRLREETGGYFDARAPAATSTLQGW